jgi:hypothetical protein
MKGIIAVCLKEMVIERFGIEKWESVLVNAGETQDISFLATGDIDDRDVLRLIQAACKAVNISMQEIADIFGEYWVNNFSQKVYGGLYRRHRTAEKFILAMDRLHLDVTRSLANASPPGFDYDWKDGKTLIMTYKSKRNMIDFAVGLIRGAGKYYAEDLQVTKINDKQLKIVFSNRCD